MARRDQVSRLQAQLAAKKLELAQLQQQVHKAEVCRRSQASVDESTKQHSDQTEDNDSPLSQSVASSRASQGLVRALSDPHSPVWISGQLYPAQYLIRHTRSMSRAQGHTTPPLIKLKLPKNMPCEEREFELPDDMFWELKQEHLLQNKSSNIRCELVKDGSVVQLSCTGLISFPGGKVFSAESAEGKLVVGQDGSCLVLFEDSLTLCQRSRADACHSYPLAKAIVCCDYIVTDRSIPAVALDTSGELALLILSDDRWDKINLSTDHLVWQKGEQCRCLSVSELNEDVVSVAACVSAVVCVWRVNISGNGKSQVMCTVKGPLVSSLKMVGDLLVVVTEQHQLMIYSTAKSAVTNPRRIPLSCCHADIPPSINISLELLSVRKLGDDLVMIMTHKPTGEPYLCSAVGWIVAVKDGEMSPFLLHTFSQQNSTKNGRLQLYVHSHSSRGWHLIGVTNNEQVIVWQCSHELPIATVNVQSTEGPCLCGVYWDPTSDSCLVLDKFKQVHCFQNTHIL